MYLSAVDGFTPPSDADREFDELRASAYEPDPDIGFNLPALARSREVEAARRTEDERRADAPTRTGTARTDVPPTAAPADAASAGNPAAPEPASSASAASQPTEEGSPRSLAQRATVMWRSRLAWGISGLVVAGGIVATVLLVSAPRPQATLHSTAAEAFGEVHSRLVEELRLFEIDTSTLCGFGSYRGLEIWAGANSFDSPCLVAVHLASNSLSESRCAPSGADLIMDVSSSGDGFEGFEGLAGDGIIRFIFRGDTVDAYVHLIPEAD
ncbi:hypothetical protein IWX65_003407 [Arthrobacter sp. CAN_A214]|uniref:hypothetical protein n=1 Tax=Arthrobacter sp. CAN_A214 TaxID=2787720 RepID=UPI0018CA3901